MFTTTHLTTSLFTIALTFGAVAPSLASPIETPKAERKAKPDAGTMLDLFKTQVDNADDEAIAKALTTLATAADEKVVRTLAKYVLHKSDEVADAAINGLGDLGAELTPRGKRLCLHAVLPVLRLTAKNPYRVGVACTSLEKIGDAACVPPLLRLLENENVKIAKAAAVVLKSVRSTAAIEPLLSQLTKLEWSPRGRMGGMGSSGATPAGAGRGNLGDKLQERMTHVKPAVVEALQAITGTSLSSSQGFRKWWKDNKRTYRIAPAAH